VSLEVEPYVQTTMRQCQKLAHPESSKIWTSLCRRNWATPDHAPKSRYSLFNNQVSFHTSPRWASSPGRRVHSLEPAKWKRPWASLILKSFNMCISGPCTLTTICWSMGRNTGPSPKKTKPSSNRNMHQSKTRRKKCCKLLCAPILLLYYYYILKFLWFPSLGECSWGMFGHLRISGAPSSSCLPSFVLAWSAPVQVLAWAVVAPMEKASY